MNRVGRLGASFVGIVVGMAALLALLPATSQAAVPNVPKVPDLAPKADGFLIFEVGVDIYDQAIWQYDRQDECDRYTGTGTHTISAQVPPSNTWNAVVPVKRTKKGARPVSYRGNGFLMEPTEHQVVPASYNLDSEESTDPTSTVGPCAPNICEDCSPSSPPQRQCGTKTGRVDLKIFGAQNGKETYVAFFDETWTPEDPFTSETSFCNDNSFWAWTSFWPGFDTDDDPFDATDRGLEIKTSKLMGYFRKLGPKQRRKCREEAEAGKWKPKICEKASYTRRHKVIQLRDIDQPGNRNYLWQQHLLTVEFKFDYFWPKSKVIDVVPGSF